MTQASWPSPSHNTRNVTDPEYERIAARFSDDGVDGSPLDAAVVAAGTGLQVAVRAGVWASVRGHAWTSGTTDVTLAVSANASGSTRADRVVLRLDRSTWDVTAVVLPGTPGAGPPALTRDDADTGVWDIPLAQVTVPNAATSVTVAREELYVGSRLRPCTSTTRPLFPRVADMAREVDTGRILAWTGGMWKIVHDDTGELTLGAGWSTWGRDGDNIGQGVGPYARIRVAVFRTDSTFSRSDPDGSMIGTVPDALRPSRYEYFAGQFTNGASCRVEVRADGGIWVRYPSSDVPAGYHLYLTMTYLR